MIKKLLMSVSVCAMTVMLACGCGSKEEPVEEPVQEEEVVLVIETPEEPEEPAFVNPLTHTEAYRPEKSFADAVKGYALFDGKVVRPKEIINVNVKYA